MSTESKRPVPKTGVLDIAPYVPGKDAAPGAAKVYKLSANETPLGPSPAVREALEGILGHLDIYPDGNADLLRESIAVRHGLNPGNILCGNGSDELLALLCQTYLSPGDEAVITEHGFLVYKIQITAAGATPVIAPETDLRTDVDAILARVTERTKLVFVANPNNPTGTYITSDEMKRLHAGLPDHVLLVIDAAYAEYVRRNDYEAGIELVSANENVVMTRTFSKIHGLAGLRIGWMYAPAHVVDAINRVRGPFNVNAAAIVAGAAAMKDRDHVERSVAYNTMWLERLTKGLEALGLVVTPSVGNFLLIHFPDEAGRTAADADAFLAGRGLVLRQVRAYGFPNALRLSIGPNEANEAVLASLKDFLDRT